MNLVDVLVVVALLIYAVAGYRTGLIRGALSIGGFVVGAVLGAKLAPAISGSIGAGNARYPVALAVLAAGALLGQLVGAALAVRLRAGLTWTPIRTLDSVLGAALSCVGVLAVVWLIALPLASSPLPQLSREVRQSRIVHAVDAAVPDPVRSAYSTVRAFAGANGFAQALGSLQPTRIFDVRPPDSSALTPVVTRARASVVKVLASGGCSDGSEGSGFVFAPGRVMTNAHVVAGMRTVSVQTIESRLPARVVLFDPARDVAVLAVSTGVGTPLRFAGRPAATSASAVVAGYPHDGPYVSVPARVRERQHVTGYAIYGRSRGGHKVSRELYSIRADVEPGNSGGPLLSTAGTVLGVVFARALDSSNTGFVLTAAEVAADARAGRSATRVVSTRACLAD